MIFDQYADSSECYPGYARALPFFEDAETVVDRWCLLEDLNFRPIAYQASALPLS